MITLISVKRPAVVAVDSVVAAVAVTNKDISLSSLVACAGCAQLTGLPGQAQAAGLNNCDIDTAVLMYAEGDIRVSALEPVVSATRNFDSETKLNQELELDTLAG